VAIRYCDSQSTQYDTSVGHPWKFWSVDLIVKYKIRLWYLKRYLLLYPRGVRRGDPFLRSTPACYSSRHQDCFYISPRFVSSLLLFLFICVCVCVWGCCWLTDKLQRARINPPAAAHQLCTSSILPPFYFLLLPSGTISSRRREIVALAQTCAHQDICEINCRARVSFVCSVASPPNPVLSYVGVFGLKWTVGGQELCAQLFFFFSFFHFFIFFLNSGFKNRFLIICATWGTTGAAVIKHMQCAQNKRKYLKN
jgi:hypothetical protein